jgi:hypothetical protein
MIDRHTKLEATFKWQGSNDGGETWIDINDAIVTTIDISPAIRNISPNEAQWNFINQDPINIGDNSTDVYYSDWRLLGVSGTISTDPNVLFMNLSETERWSTSLEMIRVEDSVVLAVQMSNL